MPRPAAPPRYKPYFFLPDGWDAGWKAAKAAVGTTPAQILFLGDSVQSGVLASDWKKSYVHLIRESLKLSLGGLHADFFPAWGLSAIPAANVPGTPPWSALNAGATDSGRQVAFGWQSVSFDGNATVPTTYYQQTFTSLDACTAFDLFYVDYGSGTWKYSVDGGTDQTVTCVNGGNNTLGTIKRISVTGLASATHTVGVGKQSAANCCIPVGIATYPTGTAGGGLAITRLCAGLTNLVADWVAQDGLSGNQHPPNKLNLLAGLVPQDSTGTGTGFGYPTQPHLAIIELGLNDCSGSSGATTQFGAGLQRFIQSFRKGRANASILIHICCNPDGNVSDNTAGFTPAVWPSFMQFYYQFAQLYNCAILNTHAKWGETPGAQGLMPTANNVHPTDAGHLDIATDILSVL